jgi:puromycin-sensitive aminopeptidase
MVAGYTGGATPQDQLRHLYALAEFDDAELVQRACEYAMSNAVKTQNAPYLLRLAIANRHHGPLAWNFVRTHWSEANERFPTNTIVRMIDSVKLLNTPEVVADVQGFFAEHRIEQAVKTQDQILERQRVNAAMRARNERELSAHLTD